MSVLDELLKVRGCQNLEPGELHISGTDPVMDSPFKLGEVAAAAHAAVGVAVNDIWELKTRRRQKSQISVRSAAASLKSNKYIAIKHKTGEYRKLVYEEHEFNRKPTDLPCQRWPLGVVFWSQPPKRSHVVFIGTIIAASIQSSFKAGRRFRKRISANGSAEE